MSGDDNLCIPQRPDGSCPAFASMHIYEKVLTVTYGMLTVLGSLHVPLIGPMALCPAMGGTLGLVGVVRAIRGLLICANASSACFSLVYLLVAFVSVPMMVETCLHLDDNRQECYHCPATSRFSTCPAHNTQDLGAYCYLSNEGSGCMADDCHELAAGSDKRCYCSHDYWGQTWDQACSEEQQNYVMPGIVPLAVLTTAIFLIGTYAATKWGCCDSDLYVRNMRREEERHADDRTRAAPPGTVTVTVPTPTRAPRRPPQPAQPLQAVAAPKPIVVVHGVTVEDAIVAGAASPHAVAGAAAAAGSAYCSSCGGGLATGGEFCPRCGTRNSAPAAAEGAAMTMMASSSSAVLEATPLEAVPYTEPTAAAAAPAVAEAAHIDHSMSSFEAEDGSGEPTQSYDNPVVGSTATAAVTAAPAAPQPQAARRTTAIVMDATTDDVEDSV